MELSAREKEILLDALISMHGEYSKKEHRHQDIGKEEVRSLISRVIAERVTGSG